MMMVMMAAQQARGFNKNARHNGFLESKHSSNSIVMRTRLSVVVDGVGRDGGTREDVGISGGGVWIQAVFLFYPAFLFAPFLRLCYDHVAFGLGGIRRILRGGGGRNTDYDRGGIHSAPLRQGKDKKNLFVRREEEEGQDGGAREQRPGEGLRTYVHFAFGRAPTHVSSYGRTMVS